MDDIRRKSLVSWERRFILVALYKTERFKNGNKMNQKPPFNVTLNLLARQKQQVDILK